jgi:O-glycosyl hydrolase
VEQVGFENPDGKKVLVVTNSGSEKKATLNQANKSAELALPADSITTLLWG